MAANFGAQAAPGGGRTVSSAALAGQPPAAQKDQSGVLKLLTEKYGFTAEQAANLLQNSKNMRSGDQIREDFKPDGKSIPESRKDTLGGELGNKTAYTETVAMGPEVVQQAAKNTNTILESMQSWRDLKKAGNDLDKGMALVAKYPVRGQPLMAPAVIDSIMNAHDTRGRFTDTTTATDAHNQMQAASFTEKDKVGVLEKLAGYKRDVMDRMAQMSTQVAGDQYRDKVVQTDSSKLKGGAEYKIGGGGSADATQKPGYVSPREKVDIADDKRLWDEVAKLGKEAQIGPATGTKEKLDIIGPIVRKYKDIPGWGADFYNRLFKHPEMATSALKDLPFVKHLNKEQLADVITLNNTLGRLNVEYIRKISGAAASDRERSLLGKLVGDSTFASDAELREALRILSKEIATQTNAVTKNYRPIVGETFWGQRDWTTKSLSDMNFEYSPITNEATPNKLTAPSAGDVLNNPSLQDLINMPTKKGK